MHSTNLDFIEEWQEESHSCKKAIRNFVYSHLRDTANIWMTVLWSDKTKIEYWALMQNSVWQKPNTAHHPQHETWWQHHHEMEMLFLSRDKEAGQNL